MSGRRAASRAFGRACARLAQYRIELALVALVLAVCGPIIGRNSAQPASRYALTAALAERGTVDISGFPIGVDKASYDGHLRSDKAPGQPVLAIPFYAAARAAGAENATHLRYVGNLGLWFVTFGTAVVPFAVLLVLMYRCCRRVAPAHALAAALATAAGAMLLPFSTFLFGHVLGATLGFAAWYVLDADPLDRRRLLACGALLGAAVCVEYHAAVVAAVLAVYACGRARRAAAWLVAGAAPFAIALGVYHWRAFGAAWRLPFGYFAGTIDGTSEGGYRLPGVAEISEVVFGAHGLLRNAPLVLVAVGAAIWLARRSCDAVVRRHSWCAVAIFVPFFLLIAGWSGMATLEAPGPRYLALASPFLAVPVAAIWSRIPRLVFTTAVFGAAIAIAAVLTDINTAWNRTPLFEYVDKMRSASFSPTIWSLAGGRLGVACYLATVGAAVAYLVRAARGGRPSSATGPQAAPATIGAHT